MTASPENDGSLILSVEDEEGSRWLELPSEPVAIPQGTLCHRCGYELGGLHSDHRCPECGAPTMISLAGNSLLVTDPFWIETVLRGARPIVASPLWLAIPGLVMTIPWLWPGNPGRALGITVLILAAVSTLAVMLLSLRGIWLFTTPHAAIALTPHALVRPAIRVAALSIPISALLIFANVVSGFGIDWPWIAVLGAPFGLTGAIGANAMCIYSSSMGKLVGSHDAVSRCRPYR